MVFDVESVDELCPHSRVCQDCLSECLVPFLILPGWFSQIELTIVHFLFSHFQDPDQGCEGREDTIELALSLPHRAAGIAFSSLYHTRAQSVPVSAWPEDIVHHHAIIRSSSSAVMVDVSVDVPISSTESRTAVIFRVVRGVATNPLACLVPKIRKPTYEEESESSESLS